MAETVAEQKSEPKVSPETERALNVWASEIRRGSAPWFRLDYPSASFDPRVDVGFGTKSPEPFSPETLQVERALVELRQVHGPAMAKIIGFIWLDGNSIASVKRYICKKTGVSYARAELAIAAAFRFLDDRVVLSDNTRT